MNEVNFSKKLAEYFSANVPHDKLGFLPDGATSIKLSNVRKLSKRNKGNHVYSFLLTYRVGDFSQQSSLVFKAYGKSLDPILRRYTPNENLRRSLKEFQILTSLKKVGYPVPKAFFYESDLKFYDSPFIVMEKEELGQNFSNNMDQFTINLVRLHSLDINALSIGSLKSPEDLFGFARRCLLYLKLFLNFYPIRNKRIEKNFKLAIRWLESNVSSNYCDKYCLLHGDYRALFNVVMTKNSRMVVIDWEDAEIGDPAYDVAMAYTRVRADSDEKTANRFIQEYLKYFDENVAKRIFFYKLLVHLRLAISHYSVLSNPHRAYEIRGLKAFVSFPFLRLPFIAKKTCADLDIIWVEKFEDFFKENLS